MLDQILERIGLKYEDLSGVEKETLRKWMEDLGKSQIGIENIKTYVDSMRDSVAEELTKTGHGTKQDLFLKARLRNYMLLGAFLSTPEKAKQALDRALAGIVAKKG